MHPVIDADPKNFGLTAPSRGTGIRFSYSQHSKISQPTLSSAGFLSLQTLENDRLAKGVVMVVW
jgi:hypothetical protein